MEEDTIIGEVKWKGREKERSLTVAKDTTSASLYIYTDEKTYKRSVFSKQMRMCVCVSDYKDRGDRHK